MGKIIYEMSPAETVIMEYLWSNTSGQDFADIFNYVNMLEDKPKAKQTVNTFIFRLIDKGLIKYTGSLRTRRYYAAVTQAEYNQGVAKTYLAQYHHGSLKNFVSALSGGKKISSSMIKELQDIIDNFN